MKRLIEGLQKFQEGYFSAHRDLFEQLSQGQHPRILFICCSDSRVDPNLITQSKVGDLFVIRNAGNIIPPYGSSRGGEESAIEFAIEGLGVRNIVICGHSHCGAMAALLGKVDLSSMPSTRQWLEHAAATKKRICTHGNSGNLDACIEENVLVQIQNLKTHASVSAALKDERLHLFGWIYDFAKGTVNVYHKQKQRFVPSHELTNCQDAMIENLSL